MLFALGQPAAALGLLVAFVLALVLRAVAQRALAVRFRLAPGPVRPAPRRDIDPFGAIGAVIGGVGWGRGAPVAEVTYLRPERRSRALVYAAGPLVLLAAAAVVLTLYRVAFPTGLALRLNRPSDVLDGVVGPFGAQFVVAVAVGLLCAGIFALVPLPPLDGFGLLWLAPRRHGEGWQRARYWLVDNNIGVVVVLLVMALPIFGGRPLMWALFDVLGTPVMRLWS